MVPLVGKRFGITKDFVVFPVSRHFPYFPLSWFSIRDHLGSPHTEIHVQTSSEGGWVFIMFFKCATRSTCKYQVRGEYSILQSFQDKKCANPIKDAIDEWGVFIMIVKCAKIMYKV